MSAAVANSSQTRDAELAEVIDRLTARLKAGDAPDLDDLVRDHPDYADELRQLFPAVRMMANLSRSANPSLAPGTTCRRWASWAISG